MIKIIVILICLLCSDYAMAQEAFSPSRAAADPNYLTSFSGAPAPTDNAITPSEVSELPPPEPPKPPEPIFTKSATFTVINKRKASKETFDAQMGVRVMSDRIEINPVKCYINKEGAVPQHAALVEVNAPRDGNDKALIYSGWIFANYPAVAFAPHAQYDVFLNECVEDAAEENADVKDVGAKDVDTKNIDITKQNDVKNVNAEKMPIDASSPDFSSPDANSPDASSPDAASLPKQNITSVP